MINNTAKTLADRHNYELKSGEAVCLKCGKSVTGEGAAMSALFDKERCPGIRAAGS